MKKTTNLRSLAARLIEQVVDKGQSLSTILPAAQKGLSDKDSALLQEICFGIARTLPQLDALIGKLMERPLTGKQRTLHYLLMVGIYQMQYTRIPAHAILAETVEGAVVLKRQSLKGLINGVLREFQRRQTELLESLEGQNVTLWHPSWLIKRLQSSWPEQWKQIINANNQRPPMWLRVNRQHHSRDNWLALLNAQAMTGLTDPLSSDAVLLEKPAGVSQLPGFSDGWVTVQDLSAQRCALYLEPQDGEDILDLCAAPGGKTTHILEIAPNARVMAVDIDAQRLSRVSENLARLKMQAEVKQGDGRTPSEWCSDRQFDRILLDAPCSATGVIRRHPDIKWLRRDNDIAELASLQAEILEAVWPHLKTGGTMIYATCSILPQENHLQISAFLQRHPEAQAVMLPGGEVHGLQVFPEQNGGDGFFYAKLIKSA